MFGTFGVLGQGVQLVVMVAQKPDTELKKQKNMEELHAVDQHMRIAIVTHTLVKVS